MGQCGSSAQNFMVSGGVRTGDPGGGSLKPSLRSYPQTRRDVGVFNTKSVNVSTSTLSTRTKHPSWRSLLQARRQRKADFTTRPSPPTSSTSHMLPGTDRVELDVFKSPCNKHLDWGSSKCKCRWACAVQIQPPSILMPKSPQSQASDAEVPSKAHGTNPVLQGGWMSSSWPPRRGAPSKLSTITFHESILDFMELRILYL